MTPGCRTPDKRRFATTEAAVLYAARRELAVGKRLTPYACLSCDWVHLTSAEPVPRNAEADPGLVNGLRHMPDGEFTAVVQADATSHLDMPHRVALRHQRLYGRWTRVLRELAAELDGRIACAPAESDWTRRATVYRHNLGRRLTEATETHRDRKAA